MLRFGLARVHYYNFSTFMTNQYWGNSYTCYCPNPNSFPCYPCPQDVQGTEIVKYYDLEDRIWLNFVVQVLMIIGYRVLAALWLHYKVTGKK